MLAVTAFSLTKAVQSGGARLPGQPAQSIDQMGVSWHDRSRSWTASCRRSRWRGSTPASRRSPAVQATDRFKQLMVDDRVAVYDACPRHAAFVAAQLADERARRPDV